MIKRVAVAALIVAACFLFVSVVSVLEFVRDVVEGTRVAMIAIRLENCDNDQACIEALRRDLGCDPDKDCFEGLHPLLIWRNRYIPQSCQLPRPPGVHPCTDDEAKK
jgi:hypothetical protein